MVQNDEKFCSSCSISQEPCIMWLSFMIHICKIIILPIIFFHFFKIFILWVFRGVKGQKMVQNDKKFCLLCLVSQEPYVIWLSFMLHQCKMITTPVGFFIFSKFWFFGLLLGVKVQKMLQNDKKLCLLHSISQEPHIIRLWFMVHICKMIISSGVFFHFFKILIFWVVRGVKGQKMVQND